MDETLLRTLLFDFYGELLTEKQRECYDLHYNSDLSLQEIAEQVGTSRQAVWDLIRRGEQSLRETEGKTGLVARALRRREKLDELRGLIAGMPVNPEQARILALLDELAD
ncbi:MAG: YlxM family DNA-binding protein [Oscillospiraceae bacterium]|nr:YlxM family DNA-binding protein [Oscillospiraceae bacterium]